ncbi:PRC-barrel domain-containing protein [Egicoccus sp. AB-alg6-2]|uniref:PRC-barrel domain-containing protein n=1 Tax=Egicoccus sp. AB-alg6-2 TaxID=3242692 RepID=UPI00359DB18B
MLGKQDLYQLIGAAAYDHDGQELGTVDTVFVDTQTDEGTFAAIRTGLFGTRSSFVPLADANFRDGELHVAYSRERVNDAPNVDADDRLDADQELELYRYYGIPATEEDADDDHLRPSHDERTRPDTDVRSGSGSSAADEGDAMRDAGSTGDDTGIPGDDLPSGADLIADQGFDPTLDGPRASPEERLRLRRLGDPASHADDGRSRRGDADAVR